MSADIPRIYLSRISPSVGDVRTIMEHDSGALDGIALWSGTPLSPNVFKDVKLYVARNGQVGDCVPNILGLPIISTRFKKLLYPLATGDVQFLETPLYDQETRKPESGYWVMNILVRIDCIDLQRSEYSYFPESDIICSFEKYYLDSKRLPSAAIFRDENTASEFFASEAVARIARRTQITGIAFSEVDVY